MIRSLRIFLVFILLMQTAFAEDGYRLWLKYSPVKEAKRIKEYNNLTSSVFIEGNSPTVSIILNEFSFALKGLLDKPIRHSDVIENGTIACVKKDHSLVREFKLEPRLRNIGAEGFIIRSVDVQGKRCTLIAANSEAGLLYGAFHLLRLMQQELPLNELDIENKPSVTNRILNHWDNLDRTVERGYAGFSIWDWHRLPGYIDQRYHDYARANASIGINGTVLTNVNANALILTEPYLQKVKALADVFRPYGIRVYLTARFSAPIETGGLTTADPLNPDVQKWWNEKTSRIYELIPDFGGFLVKANSEGQPGPQNYGRTHADGANLLARAVRRFNGIVMWRAFVYSHEIPVDRVKQAYDEFMPLDGKFDSNVLVQVKNGPLDFQPREPFHPLFGAMTKTPLMMEFQLTQEYLGFATHLVYLGTLFKETLDSDTYQRGAGSSVSKAIDGSMYGHKISAMAGVANIGNDRNWCGHPFAQANWYAFGRLSWDMNLPAREIADEWIRQTFGRETPIITVISEMMMSSREITVNYMTPLGLHHIMGYNHHYGPAPWITDKQREDWTSVYYHRADPNGIGFDRTSKGSDALSQYHPSVIKKFMDAEACPEEYLLWFHRIPWDFKLNSSRTLWEELCFRYNDGASKVREMQRKWNSLGGSIDAEQFAQVKSLLEIQYSEARWWRDACLLYFEKVSGRPIPPSFERPSKDLLYFQTLEFPFAPGIKPKW
jgi:alpha-glucuronidase